MPLAPADAAALAEMLQFLSDWLARDHHHLETPLRASPAGRAYRTQQLRDDLARFIFLLGGSDGEPLFDPERQQNTPSARPRHHYG